MSEVSVNLNHVVRVKLTEEGKRIIALKNLDCLAKYGFTSHKFEEDGTYKTQLWVLIHEFGEFCFLGCNPPFETEIVIEDQREDAEQRGLDWAARYLEDIADANLGKSTAFRAPHYMQLAHEIRLLKKEGRVS